MHSKWLPLIFVSVSVSVSFACGSSVEESNDSSTGSSSGDPQTSSPSTTMSMTGSPSTTSMPTTTTQGSSEDSTGTGDDTTGDDTTGTLDSSSSDDGGTTGEPADRTCLGVTQYDSLGNVLGREGTDAPEACDATPAPCGGDLVGRWVPAVTCGYEDTHNPFAASCPGSVVTITSVEQTGTVEFVDDGTFLQEFATTQNYTITMDAESCFAIGCDALEGVLDETTDATCTGPDDACECDVVSFDDDAVGGTYEIVGDTLVLTVSGQAALPYPYCVADDRLDMWSPLTDIVGTGAVCDVVDDCEAALGDMYDAYACVDISEE